MSAYCARWNGVAVAESDDTIVVGGHRYFPVGSVVRDRLIPSTPRCDCGPRHGTSFYDIVVGDDRHPNAAWYYADPTSATAHVEGYIGFWRGVEIVEVSAVIGHDIAEAHLH